MRKRNQIKKKCHQPTKVSLFEEKNGGIREEKSSNGCGKILEKPEFADDIPTGWKREKAARSIRNQNTGF